MVLIWCSLDVVVATEMDVTAGLTSDLTTFGRYITQTNLLDVE
jgi:hypothetical protein